VAKKEKKMAEFRDLDKVSGKNILTTEALSKH